MKKLYCCLMSTIVWLVLCCSPKPKQLFVLTQISTIDALLAGCYDGVAPIRELHRYGDFGIGTFNKLDGEMIVLNDTLYQIQVDGNAKTTQLPDSTPLATLIPFHADIVIPISRKMPLDTLKEYITRRLPNANLFYAVKISGQFEKMKTRSIPPQEKPYAPLSDVVAKQQKFRDSENISGTVVGFSMPAFVKGINVPGYHLHFISADRKIGGHLFECMLVKGTVELQKCHQLNLILPDVKSGFGSVDFAKDRSSDLEKVIKLKKD